MWIRLCPAAVAALLILPSAAAAIEGDGQADLNRAIEAKVTAEKIDDFAEVISLCQRALDKGLDDENADFARKLLSATLEERGRLFADAIFGNLQPDPRWRQLRRQALDDFQRAARHNPDEPRLHMMIARLEALPGGQPAAAVKALDEALRLAGDDAELKFHALVMRAELQEDVQQRIADFTAAIKLAPHDPLPVRARGAVHLGLNNPAEALRDFDAALALEPQHAGTYELRGIALTLLGRTEEARASFSKSVDLAPNPIALLRRAQMHAEASDFESALRDATQALALDPDHVPALLLRAQINAQARKHDEALADVNAALRLAPNLLPARRMRGVLLAITGKNADALADLEAVNRQAPGDVELLFQLAMLHRNARRHDQALALLNEAIEIEPANGLLRHGRADVLLGVGRQKEAIADYEQALKAKPKDSSVLNNLAWVLATSPEPSLRDGKRAVELATKAAELTDYKAAHILSTLAAAYAETGDFESARKWSRTSLEVADDDARPNLEKELASYLASQPWREIQHEGEIVTQVPSGDKKR